MNNDSPTHVEVDPEEHIIRKRLPRRLPKRKNDIYVSRKTNATAQLARCQKLLDTDFNEIFIHGLGVACNRAVNLALQLKVNGRGSIDISAHTSTVELVDDLEPLTDEAEAGEQVRNSSAIHIRVFRPERPLAAAATPRH